MENEDIGFWLFMPSWNKDHLSDMPCNLNQIILGLYSSTELPCIPFLPKPLNFPPIIFCYSEIDVFLFPCAIYWYESEVATVTGRGYKWVGCVIGPGIPSDSLNSSNCQPCSFMDVDHFISKSFMLIGAESIPNNSVPIPSSLLFSDKTRFMGQPLKQKDKS